MKQNSIKKSQAWNPILIGVLSFLFSFLPAGIFFAINFERLGYPQKKNSSLILVILGFIIFTVAFLLIPQEANPIPIFTVINAAVSGYFIYSQNTFYKQYLEKGGEKAEILVPIIVSILWFIFIMSAILYIPYRQTSELDLNPKKALVEAADHGDIDLVESLIEQGINVNVNHKGRTALYEAAVNGKEEILKLLIQAGADANAEDIESGVTPLYMVAMENRGGFEKTNKIVKLLVKGGADPNVACTESKISPLMWLVENGNFEGVKFLVENGADVNLKREDGKTALSLAVKNNEEDIIKILKTNVANE